MEKIYRYTRTYVHLYSKGMSISCWLLIMWVLLPLSTLANSPIATSAGVYKTDVSVTGSVLDEQKQPLVGVSISIKGTSIGTITDSEGKYKIIVPTGNETLMFSFVGYLTEEIAVGGRSQIDIFLIADITTLGDIVVIGYGSVKKSDLTGSVVSLKAKDLNPGANMNVEQALLGRAAGVQVYQKSGEPGAAMSVKIRGTSSITAGSDPLYVIDGMPVNNAAPATGGSPGFAASANARNPLNSLNPSDIESIEILKDASATAIYGSRGANGVVIITTKKGSEGKLQVNYNTYYGIQEASKKIKVLEGSQYKDILNSIIRERVLTRKIGDSTEKITHQVVNTDWQDLLYQKASVQSHEINFSGGKENTRFYASLNYFNQQGVVKNSSTERYVARINLDNSVDKKYGIGFTMNASYIKDQYNSVGLGLNENGSALYAALNYDPSYSAYDTTGNYYRSPFMTTVDHPVALIEGQWAKSDAYRIFGTVFGEYFIIPELSVKLRAAGDVNTNQRNTWVGPTTIAGLQSSGIATVNSATVNYYMGEATLNFNKTLGLHAISGVLGSTYEYFGSYSFGATGRGYALPDLTYNAIQTGDPTRNEISSGRASNKLISYLGRVNYTYNSKYLLTVSFRADGSARFGLNNRFGYFPSAAVAWKIHEESFLKNVSFLDELKLRISYGAIGNQSIGNYLYLSTLSPGDNVIFRGIRNNSLAPSRVPNPDLKWEATKQGEIGIDFAFLARRISGSIDVYQRNTTDLLLNLPLPQSTGFNAKVQNVGSLKNTGVDVLLNGYIMQTEHMKWSLSGNISFFKNEVVSLGSMSQIFLGSAGNINNVSIIKPGESLGAYYGYQVLGVWQADDDFTKAPANVKAGDLKFLDLDSNKTINASDRVVLGKALPDFNYGFSSTFEYKGLSLSVFFEGSQGGSIINSFLVDSYFPVSTRRNKIAEPYLNRWTPQNPTNEYPSFVAPTSQGQQQVNSRTVENASYLRFQSARVAYNFNLNTKYLHGLTVYVTGQNLWTFSKYSGIDPSVNAIGNDFVKIDYNTYPLTRTYMAGINVQF